MENKIDKIVNTMIEMLVYSVEMRSIYGLDNDPINWASISCYAVKETSDGEYYIYIDEAAPDAHNLKTFIKRQLEFLNIKSNIITEW